LFSDHVKSDKTEYLEEKGIKWSWDRNSRDGVWLEILHEDRIVMQIEESITLDQMLELFKMYQDNPKTEVFDIDGPDFWLAVKDEDNVASFIEANPKLFNNT